MARKAYPSDLTDAEWQLLEPLIPPAKSGGHPRTVNMREILNAILYLMRTGCSWQMLPHDLPPSSTVYLYLRRWQKQGIWEQMKARLLRPVEHSRGSGDRACHNQKNN